MSTFKEKFLASFSHELKTPLNCSLTNIQLLLSDPLIDPYIKKELILPTYYSN